jgi:ferredoxin
MYLIEKENVMKIAEELAKNYELFGPVVDKGTGQVFFDRVNDSSEISLSAEIPAIPPKHVVFPQIERIMKYKYDRSAKKAEIEAILDNRSKAIFGIRPCDLTGLIVLDRFFLGQEFVDEIYREHRKRMFIVSQNCIAPFKQCFCVCTDSGPFADEGYDLNLTLLGDYYLVEAGSDKGKELVQRLGLKSADPSYAEMKKKANDKSISLFESIATDNKAWISRVMNRITTGFIKEDVWEYIGKQCFECGACTFVCPTCSCFNVEEHNRFDGTTDRLRTWDSCSFEGYTKMAGDHNPRHPVEDRRNKRFFCKLSYSQSKKYLRPGCVGCGRCQWVCPGDIGLPNVVTYIRREITE